MSETTNIQSPPFRIIGTEWVVPGDQSKKVHQIRDAVVKLITFAEQSVIDQVPETGPISRRRTFIAKSLVRLGDIPGDRIPPQLIDRLAAPDIDRIEQEIKKLNVRAVQQTGMRIQAPAILSDPIQLRPGVMIDGHLATTCQVRLLTRADRVLLQDEPDLERGPDALARSIACFGECDDPDLIRQAVDCLTVPDEMRIQSAALGLQAKYCDLDPDEEQAPAQAAYSIQAADILSEAFNLNPGILVNGEPATECVVRLMTRGEWKRIQSAPESDQDFLAHIYSIARIGRVTDRAAITEAYYSLTQADVKRVDREVGRLQASFRDEGEPTDA
ncbi:MAG TPA: hypothetical protein VJX67_04835 [Blastocatellia bacterium]|nr:hypothetical protein [Blastocatellia bacterium]